MAYQGHQILHTFIAGEDLSSDQFKPVYIGSDGKIYNDDSTGTRKFLGVLQDKPASGVAGLVCLFGITKVVVAGATTTGVKYEAGTTPYTVGLVLAGTGGAGVATVLVTQAENAE